MNTMNSPLLLEGGLVVDGSGAPAWTGDVLIVDGRIERLGTGLREHLPEGLNLADVTVVACLGKVICPGFIDAHTHDDAAILRTPDYVPKLSQGITTVITGNCGISLAPYAVASARPPLTLLGADSFRYASLAAYHDAVQAVRPAINVASLIGHTTLRFATMGDLSKAASGEELIRMCALLQDGMDEGCLGLSSGLFYEEAFAAPTSEVEALARVVARNAGVYATHLRSEMETIIEALHEAGDTAFSAGVPLVISHHKCAGPANWGRTLETLPIIEALATRQPLSMDVYPYVAGSTVLREDLVDGVIDVMLTWSDPHPEMGGRFLAEIAAEWGISQREAAIRLKPGGACYFQMHEQDVERVITHPLSMIGSDGLPHDRHPHPRLWGAFPRVLARYWRAGRQLTLEQAIHKMSGLTARNFRLSRRGLLRAGYHADVVVLDPARVADTATYEHPVSPSAGIEAVYVNGVLSYREAVDGQWPEVLCRAGRVLRNERIELIKNE